MSVKKVVKKSQSKKTVSLNQETTAQATPGTTRSVAMPPSEDAIRRRAYQLYEKRGRTHGHALEDWVTAETEIAGPVAHR